MGLGFIHANDLIHRDFHVGNILQDGTRTFISDYGLCKPANESNDKKIYGVMPYIAPEILHKKPYTKESDIYSLGIIINAIISGGLPFNDRPHDRFLALDICRGLRPEIRNEVPQALKELIQKCWNADPKNRPTILEIKTSISDLLSSYDFKTDKKTTIDSMDTLTLLSYPKTHSQAIYKSRLLDLPDDLPEPVNYTDSQEPTSIINTIQVQTGNSSQLFITYWLIQLAENSLF